MRAAILDSSVIGKSVAIEGEISGQGDLVFEGKLKGSVNLPQNRFTLRSTGEADCSVVAKQVAIAGTLTGDVQAESVELRETAHLTGTIRCERISIEAGATIVATIETTRKAEAVPSTPKTAEPALAASISYT